MTWARNHRKTFTSLKKILHLLGWTLSILPLFMLFAKADGLNDALTKIGTSSYRGIPSPSEDEKYVISMVIAQYPSKNAFSLSCHGPLSSLYYLWNRGFETHDHGSLTTILHAGHTWRYTSISSGNFLRIDSFCWSPSEGHFLRGNSLYVYRGKRISPMRLGTRRAN